MKNAIILHGKAEKNEYYDANEPSPSNAHWLPWLQKQLLMRDIAAATPEVPFSFEPNYAAWCKEFERYDLTPETLLVGHSCGGGFLVRWLSEHSDVTVGKVVLVAPWIDPFRDETTDFFEFTIDPGLASRTKQLVIFNSDDDYDSVHESVHILRETVKDITYREFAKHGHFCYNDLHTYEFPELLKELLKP